MLENNKEIRFISYSFGVVDLFNYGHLKGLKLAGENADYHVFGLVTDRVAKNWMGDIVSSQEERMAVMESNRFIDEVMLQDSMDPTDNLKELHSKYPDAVITLYHGTDISVFPAEGYLNTIGGKVEIFEYSEKFSPKNIYSHFNTPQKDNARYSNILSTKANTLLTLQSKIKKAKIEKITIVTVREYQTDFEDCYQTILKAHNGHRIVVRSSSKREDSFFESNAGHFESVLNLDVNDKAAVYDAIGKVVDSYACDGQLLLDDQILIQDMTDDVKISGVVFSRDIQNNRPYYVINYDESGSTDLVTSGIAGKSIWIAYDLNKEEIPEKWDGLFAAVDELESIFRNILLDIEFAIKTSGEVVLFQVRPLAASYRYGNFDDDSILFKIKKTIIEDYQKTFDFNEPILSDMAFWNPAEIIGSNPRPLDYSLYKRIITRKAWNSGLVEMGYRKVSHNLMYQYGNKPYISVDYSFESLCPAALGQNLTQKLIKYYRNCLKNNPSSHDKIEFEIALNCYDFTTEKRLETMISHGFTEEELRVLCKELKTLTKGIITDYEQTLKNDLADLKILEARRNYTEVFLEDRKTSVQDYVEQIDKLLEAIELFGTPQFTRQARCAFVAKSICQSLVVTGTLTQGEYDGIMSSISTVAEQLNEDIARLHKCEAEKEDIVSKYGHLRAGTYDIRIPRYDQNDFFDSAMASTKPDIDTERMEDLLHTDRVIRSLDEYDVGYNSDQLVFFIKNSIQQREYFKFIFTKSLSRCLELIADLGNILGIDRNDMSYVDVADIVSLLNYENRKEMRDFLTTIIAERKQIYQKNLGLILPECIFGVTDFNWIEMSDTRPNFITSKTVTAKTAKPEIEGDSDLDGKIVVLEKADPGYDWIFTKRIAGLVTKYGGAASHMAIRCAEFSIPAAIGCGEKLYRMACDSKQMTIDCKKFSIRF